MKIEASEIETFSSLLRADVSAGAQPPFQMSLQGPVRVEAFNKIGNLTGTFATEMLSMDLAGSSPLGPIMVRESPTLPSLGETTITDIGGGLFRFDSFFDVFTELTIDGGQTWIPQERGPARVNLVPEPSAVVLLGIGVLGAAGRRLLRRWKTA